MEEERKIEDKKTEKNIACCSGNHGVKVVLIVLAFLFVACGVVGVAKLVFLRHNFGRIATQKETIEERSFGVSRGGRMMQGQGGRGGENQGIIGRITKIDGDNVTIHKDSSGKDYIIVIADTTQIRKDSEIASKTDLAIGQAITVRGGANSSGQILANILIIN
jgi:hypothetical protein